MNTDYNSALHAYAPSPKNPEAFSFWERGRLLFAEAEKYRRTDWTKFSALVWKAVRLQSAAVSLDDALSLA